LFVPLAKVIAVVRCGKTVSKKVVSLIKRMFTKYFGAVSSSLASLIGVGQDPSILGVVALIKNGCQKGVVLASLLLL